MADLPWQSALGAQVQAFVPRRPSPDDVDGSLCGRPNDEFGLHLLVGDCDAKRWAESARQSSKQSIDLDFNVDLRVNLRLIG